MVELSEEVQRTLALDAAANIVQRLSNIAHNQHRLACAFAAAKEMPFFDKELRTRLRELGLEEYIERCERMSVLSQAQIDGIIHELNTYGIVRLGRHAELVDSIQSGGQDHG